MPKTIELCVYDSLFQKRAAIDPTLLKSVIARDESLKIEVANDIETVFAFDDEHHEWSPILRLHEQFPTISAPILSHPYAYYKLTEVADSASACLYSEGNLLYIPGYGMLVDPEENKHIEATPEALGQLVRQGVGVKEAINKLQELKEQTPVPVETVTAIAETVPVVTPTVIIAETLPAAEAETSTQPVTELAVVSAIVQPEVEAPAAQATEAETTVLPAEQLKPVSAAQQANAVDTTAISAKQVEPVSVVQPAVTTAAVQQETPAATSSDVRPKRIKPALVVAVVVAIAAIIFLILK